MVALIWRKPAPGGFVFAKRCLLLWGHAIPLAKLLTDLGLLVRRKILKRPAVLQHALALLRRKVSHLVDPGPRGAYTKLLARCRDVARAGAVAAGAFSPAIWRGIKVLPRRLICIRAIARMIVLRRWRIVILRMWSVRVRLRLVLRRPVGMRILRGGKSRQREQDGRGQGLPSELEFSAHYSCFRPRGLKPLTLRCSRTRLKSCPPDYICSCCCVSEASSATGAGKLFNGSKFCRTS